MEKTDLKFDKEGLLPAIIQDLTTGEVLMLAYMNEEAFNKTIETGRTWFWSRSRQELWCKGEKSGNKQFVKEIRYDCDNDALLVLVEQIGVACHTGNRTCFYRAIGPKLKKKFYSTIEIGKTTLLEELYQVILSRKMKKPEGSYTASLFKEGTSKILDKVSEEAQEVISATKANDKGKIISEISDLFYHLLVLLVQCNITLEDIETELAKRKR